MDPVSALVAALVAGATAAASDTASVAVKDSYQGLKTILVDVYQVVSARLLDKKPSNMAYQQALQEEIQSNPDIPNDEKVIGQLANLQTELGKVTDHELSSWGVDVESFRAAGNFIAENITGRDGGLRAKSIEAAGDIKLSDIHGGKSGN